MNALLLSAGYGSRISSFVKTKPKCLIKIRGKEILSYWLDILDNKNVKKIIINTHYQAEKIEKFVNNHRLKNKIVLSYEKKILGSIGTLIKNIDLLSEKKTFLVAHSDNLTKFNIQDFIKFNKNNNKPHSLMTFRTNDTLNTGVFVKKNNRIINYIQKKKNNLSDLANAAVFIFDRSIFQLINKKKYFDISSDLIPEILNKISLYENKNFFIDIGQKKNLLYARKNYK